MQTVLMVAMVGAGFLAIPFVALQRLHIATGTFMLSAACSTGLAFIARPFSLNGLAFAVVAVLTIATGVSINPRLFLRVHRPTQVRLDTASR